MSEIKYKLIDVKKAEDMELIKKFYNDFYSLQYPACETRLSCEDIIYLAGESRCEDITGNWGIMVVATDDGKVVGGILGCYCLRRNFVQLYTLILDKEYIPSPTETELLNVLLNQAEVDAKNLANKDSISSLFF